MRKLEKKENLSIDLRWEFRSGDKQLDNSWVKHLRARCVASLREGSSFFAIRRALSRRINGKDEWTFDSRVRCTCDKKAFLKRSNRWTYHLYRAGRTILEVIEKIALLAPLSAKSVLDTQPRINQPNVIGETEPPIFDEQTW